MIKLSNVISITDLQRNPKAALARVKKSETPLVLTVNGKPELVIHNADSFDGLLERLRRAEDLAAIREGLGQSLAGQGRPAMAFFEEFEAKSPPRRLRRK